MENPTLIYQVHEYGATDSWDWSAYLTKNSDGSFHLLLTQELWDNNSEVDPARYELSDCNTGAELFEFLQSAWYSEHYENLPPSEWDGIVENITKVSKKLATEVLQTVDSHLR